MQKPCSFKLIVGATLIWLTALASIGPIGQAAEPITYAVKFPAPATHIAEVEAKFPTAKRPASDTIELMLPGWSPGFYRVEDYASRVQNLTARAADGQALTVEQPGKNRWRITTKGAANVIVSYHLHWSFGHDQLGW